MIQNNVAPLCSLICHVKSLPYETAKLVLHVKTVLQNTPRM